MLRIRTAVATDSRDLWEWRNDLVSRAASNSTAPVSWSTHETWFARTLMSPDRTLLIGEQDGAKVGMCRFDLSGAAATVSINLNPAFRGKGLARPLLDAAIREFWTRTPNVALHAEIRTDNLASKAIFTQLGFHLVSSSDEIETYELPTTATS